MKFGLTEKKLHKRSKTVRTMLKSGEKLRETEREREREREEVDSGRENRSRTLAMLGFLDD